MYAVKILNSAEIKIYNKKNSSEVYMYDSSLIFLVNIYTFVMQPSYTQNAYILFHRIQSIHTVISSVRIF